MSVQTPESQMVTQAWETAHHPLEFQLGLQAVHLAEAGTVDVTVPPQRRTRRSAEVVTEQPSVEVPAQALPVLVQNGPNFLDADNNVVAWQEGFAMRKAGQAVLQLTQPEEV